MLLKMPLICASDQPGSRPPPPPREVARIGQHSGQTQHRLAAAVARFWPEGAGMAHLSPPLITSPFPTGLLMALPAGQWLLPVTHSLHEWGRLEGSRGRRERRPQGRMESPSQAGCWNPVL